jgi:hypothetical protein
MAISTRLRDSDPLEREFGYPGIVAELPGSRRCFYVQSLLETFLFFLVPSRSLSLPSILSFLLPVY